MGEALFNFYNTDSRFIAKSAGVEPASEVNPMVVEAMKEKGVEMVGQYPKMLTVEMAENAYKIIRMCGKDACMWAPEEKTEDWNLKDSLGRSIEKVRKIRDILEVQVKNLVSGLSTL